MKIVHLCLSAVFSDGFSYQENILPKYHVKMGHDVSVITNLFTWSKEGKGVYYESPVTYMDESGFKVIRLSYKKPLMKINRKIGGFDGLFRTLEAEKPDIIFTHGGGYTDAKYVVKYLKKHPATRLFADSHADYINSATNFLSKYVLHKIIWKHSSKVLEPFVIKWFGVTPQRCRFLKEMYDINPKIIDFLPMGVDDEAIPQDRETVRERVRNELGVAKDDVLVFTGGKINKAKRLHKTIEALEVIHNEKIHLVICGVLDQEMEYLKDKFDNVNAHYLGWCDADRVMDCMVASDLACFPGTHSTLWEQSIGVGLPAIFKHWKEMEHVNVCDNCVLLETEETHELQNALNTIVNEKYDQMKQNAVKASKFFLYSEIAKKAIQS